MRHIFKSIGVVLFAFVVNALLSVVTDFLLEWIGVLPDPQKGLFETWSIVLVLFYSGVYTIFTGFLLAKLFPERAMLHAFIIGIIGVVITVAATVSPGFAEKSPQWFGFTLAAITIPCLVLEVRIQKLGVWKFSGSRSFTFGF